MNFLCALYKAGVKDDKFAPIHKAKFIFENPQYENISKSIHENVMQGDVLSPHMSSNMVNIKIGKAAVKTWGIYITALS